MEIEADDSHALEENLADVGRRRGVCPSTKANFVNDYSLKLHILGVLREKSDRWNDNISSNLRHVLGKRIV